ncbi:distal tail protein Dit [Paraclostridium sordellii]|uniref:distal tail protein Dit n=1 Tax=Paraclostridium sordellii TaxID=1505 RepID=UPI001FA95C87|nr:distal tail protein Dit [Paeniclostridium sordellii]
MLENKTVKTGEYENLSLDLTFRLKRGSIWDRIDEIMDWLTNIENNNLTLSVMTDRYYLVKKVSTENIIEEYVRYGKFEVNFILEPFRYIKDERYIETSYSPIKLYYSGSYPGECNIKIYGRNNIQLTVNDETIQINNVDGYVELDSKLLLCLNRDKTSKTRDMIGNFPILTKGENIITWDGNITRVEILPRTAFK